MSQTRRFRPGPSGPVTVPLTRTADVNASDKLMPVRSSPLFTTTGVACAALVAFGKNVVA